MKKITFLLLLMITFGTTIYSQGTISSIVPNTAAAGTTFQMVVRGSGTTWDGTINSSNISFLPNNGDYTISNVSVTGAEMLTMTVTLKPNASGEKTLQIIQGTKTYVCDQKFEIITVGSPLTVNLIVNPIQTINLADFDPNNLNSSPVIFNVNIMNDNVARSNMLAKLEVKGEKLGEIGTATKKIPNIGPSIVFTFNNKDFDNYTLNQSNKDFFNSAVNTGNLPADEYEYTITLFDDKGVQVGKGSAKSVISNPTTNPELISPGVPMSSTVEVLRTPLPLFQWFSQGENFELAVYPVLPNQTAEQATLNRPIFKQDKINSTSFLYPSTAAAFINNQIYAWQIKRMISTSSGNNVLSSEVFWFRYQSGNNPTLNVSEIKITPEEAAITAGSSFQFNAIAFSANNEPITNAVFEWKVVPSTAGTITANGLFTAANTTGSAAVIAKCNGIPEYSTVIITPAYMNNLSDAAMRAFIEKLFGLTK